MTLLKGWASFASNNDKNEVQYCSQCRSKTEYGPWCVTRLAGFAVDADKDNDNGHNNQ